MMNIRHKYTLFRTNNQANSTLFRTNNEGNSTLFLTNTTQNKALPCPSQHNVQISPTPTPPQQGGERYAMN